MTHHQILTLAREAGFSAGLIPTADIPFDHSFRKYCAENLCGNFGANWSCPPDCGSPELLESRLKEQSWALVLCSDHDVADYKDRAAVLKAKRNHNRAALALAEQLKQAGYPGLLAGGGPCDLCDLCARAEGRPCTDPERMFSCLSAYCVHVKALADAAGLEMALVPGRMSLFGLYAFSGPEPTTLGHIAVERYLTGGKGCAAGILEGANAYYGLGLTTDAIDLFTGFRGGMGCGSTCGSLIGAIGVLNHVYKGRPELKDYCAQFVARFEQTLACGSLDCAAIEKKYKTPETRCAAAVARTADLLEQFLAEHPL